MGVRNLHLLLALKLENLDCLAQLIAVSSSCYDPEIVMIKIRILFLTTQIWGSLNFELENLLNNLSEMHIVHVKLDWNQVGPVAWH